MQSPMKSPKALRLFLPLSSLGIPLLGALLLFAPKTQAKDCFRFERTELQLKLSSKTLKKTHGFGSEEFCETLPEYGASNVKILVYENGELRFERDIFVMLTEHFHEQGKDGLTGVARKAKQLHFQTLLPVLAAKKGSLHLELRSLEGNKVLARGKL